MSDPTRDLAGLDAVHLGAAPLPASEVRRRGDRLRRRNAALVTAGAGAAVAAVLVPVALLAGGSDRATPSPVGPAGTPSATAPATPSEPAETSTGTPTEAPTTAPPETSSTDLPGATETPTRSPDDVTAPPAVATSFPPGFPVDVDRPGTSAADGGTVEGPSPEATGAGEIDLCGASIWTVEPVDRLAFTVTGPEFADGREVRVHDSADVAVAEMAAVRAALAACPEEPVDGGTEQHRTYDVSAGYETITWSVTSDTGLGAELHQLVRVGSAVMATTVYGEFGQRIGVDYVRERTRQTAPITDAMCRFTVAGCG